MSSKANNKKNAPELTASAVADYLKKHTAFFEQHPDVLAEINLTHECDGAVSLVQRQITMLREQQQKSKRQLENLVAIARDNDKLNEHMHRLTLALMDANNLNEVQVALDDTLRGEFQADAVNIKLFIDPEEAEVNADDVLVQTVMIPINDPQLDDFKTILSSEKPVCGTLTPEQLEYMFNDEAENIKSTAIIPLGGENCNSIECAYLGILTIGSYSPDRYTSSMGTLFLSNLGEIVSRAIRAHLVRTKTG